MSYQNLRDKAYHNSAVLLNFSFYYTWIDYRKYYKTLINKHVFNFSLNLEWACDFIPVEKWL